jgi:hypothetical protein
MIHTSSSIKTLSGTKHILVRQGKEVGFPMDEELFQLVIYELREAYRAGYQEGVAAANVKKISLAEDKVASQHVFCKRGNITEEGRRKISEAVSRPVSIDGVRYRSIKQAAESLGIPRHQVKMVLKGVNTVEYYRQKLPRISCPSF